MKSSQSPIIMQRSQERSIHGEFYWRFRLPDEFDAEGEGKQ